MDWTEFVGTVLLLFGLSNPVGVIPIYLHLAHNVPSRHTVRLIVTASVTVAVLLTAAALCGTQILNLFNVGLDDFRIAGGLLVLLIAFEMFRARFGSLVQTAEERAEAELDHSVAIAPLAFPLLAGPGEMSVMITLSNDYPRLADKAPLIGAILTTATLILITLWLAKPLSRLLGTTGINVTTRVMALIVASVGIHFIVTGLQNHFPGLTTG
ncbi:MAG TPA: MarC family protein [Gemmatimonadaceae bacterium]|nr:MarC family protein [Gemmatimonadaceae bacterium]